jgi:hypothetical protein
VKLVPRLAALVALTLALSGCVADTVATDVTQVQTLEEFDATVSVIDGWPSVTVPTLDDFSEVFHRVSGQGMFADGGTFTLLSDKHLQIVHIPARSSDESIDAIIQLAIDYPDAEILLQATTAGPQWPTLYVARLTPEQVTEVQTQLLDPSLADADIEGYPMPFILTTIGADGPVYTYGNLGGVPD